MRIIISNIHLKNFGGSELVAVELAEYYASKNWQVTLYSPTILPPLMGQIGYGPYKSNIKLTTELPHSFREFDIIWSHHGLLLNRINAKTCSPSQHIVSCHMSSYLSIEQPIYDPDLVHVILANSVETKLKFSDLYRNKARLFQNPAPPPKGNIPSTRPDKLLGIAISNHRPAGLDDFLRMQIKAGRFDIHFIGEKDVQARMSPEILANYDFAICNGKSVQFALRAGVPVFVYDQFKGCGWLTEENFDRAQEFNFSGRGFFKNAELEEILNVDHVLPIKMTEERMDAFYLERRLKALRLI